MIGVLTFGVCIQLILYVGAFCKWRQLKRRRPDART